MILPLLIAGVALAAAGTATSIYGASQANKANKEGIAIQQQMEAQRRQAMELDAYRRQIENIRNVQRARAMGLTSATNQGAGRGSGLQGGLAQAFGQGMWNAVGLNQQLGIGRNMFGLNAELAQTKMAASNAQMIGQVGSGLTSLGGSLMGSMGAVSNLTSGFGAPSGGGMGGGPSYYQPGGYGYVG